jgi:DNA-binding NarL/FixJ family response regulator
MTNRQVATELVVSQKTVEYHLGNVYTKLGVNSRTALTTHLLTRQHAREEDSSWPSP